MKPLAALAALTLAAAATVLPALARDGYVVDDAHLLSQGAITQINQQVGDFHAQTGKEVVVVTTPSLDGASPDAAIERSFAQQQVNGVEIFIAKNDHVIRIAGDRASSRFFPSGSYQSIAQSMRASFRSGDYDGGVENAVSLIVNTYRGHESSLNRNRQPAAAGGAVHQSSTGGSGLGWIWWVIILAVIFFVIRGIFRAMSRPRYGPPGMGGPGYGGPGYGPGPGYGGPGYGYGGGYGGGGGFWSGLLGGLGGAWLGNELFGGRREEIINQPGDYSGMGGDGGNVADAGGWQNDPGQIDTSNIGGSSWGDGGGDAGWGGGGGDWGGGGGGDFGGGGDNSGGGW